MAGTYDPIPKPPPLGVGKPYKDIKLDTARAKYWLGVGAQPSDPVWRLLSMVRPTIILGLVSFGVVRTNDRLVAGVDGATIQGRADAAENGK